MARMSGTGGGAGRKPRVKRNTITKKMELRGNYGPTATRKKTRQTVAATKRSQAAPRKPKQVKPALRRKPGINPGRAVSKAVDGAGRAITGFLGNVAPQDMLFKGIGNRLKNLR